MVRSLFPLFLLAACEGKVVLTGDTAPAAPDDSGTPPDDTATHGETSWDTPQVDGFSVTVDDDIGSLLWAGWTQTVPATVWVEYRFEGDTWLRTPSRVVAAGDVRQLVAGVPYGQATEVRVVNDFGPGPLATDPVSVTTDDLPDDVPEVSDIESVPERWDPATNWIFLSLADQRSGSWILILDRQGRVVWAWPSSNGRISLHPRVSLDGTDLLVDENSYWASFDGGEASQILRMKLDGTITETIDVPGMHHPFTDMPDGSIVYTAMGSRSETLDRRWPDGSIDTIWDCRDLLEEVDDSGYCGSNTIWYNPADGHVLNSIYSIETVVDVDVEAGTTDRWFGHINDSWQFDPPESAFWWQHGGNLTSTGTFLTSSKGEDSDDETVIREYRLDEDTHTLVEVWSFGAGEGIYGDVMGEAHRLANGNTLHNLGSATRIREVTADGEVVWDVDWRADTMGRSTPIEDLYTFVE